MSSNGSNDAASLGKGLFDGLLQGLGLDGSVFSNPLEWPNFKPAMALVNWGCGLLQQMFGGGSSSEGPESSSALLGGGGSLLQCPR